MRDDLFGSAGMKPCADCGRLFYLRYGVRGRPQRFCSDICRTATAKQQRSAWRVRNATAQALICWGCNAPMPPQSGPGRLGRYCSTSCRRRGTVARRLARRLARRSARLTV